VPGHYNIPGNEKADILAKEAITLVSTTSSSISNAKRRMKEKLLKDWRKEWNDGPQTGHFTIADCFCPSLKTTLYFCKLKKQHKVFGHMIQCRTAHGYIGKYYQH
jgi:hypothetical protein